jgi:hypothetical protein
MESVPPFDGKKIAGRGAALRLTVVRPWYSPSLEKIILLFKRSTDYKQLLL